jgi:hypothetical protein
MLDSMRSEHLAVIRREVAGIEASLAPALRALGGRIDSQTMSPVAHRQSWQSHVFEIFPVARRLEKLMAAVLGGASPEGQDEGLASRLLTAVEQMRTAASGEPVR